MDPVKLCTILSVILGATSFMVSLGASQTPASTPQVTFSPVIPSTPTIPQPQLSPSAEQPTPQISPSSAAPLTPPSSQPPQLPSPSSPPLQRLTPSSTTPRLAPSSPPLQRLTPSSSPPPPQRLTPSSPPPQRPTQSSSPPQRPSLSSPPPQPLTPPQRPSPSSPPQQRLTPSLPPPLHPSPSSPPPQRLTSSSPPPQRPSPSSPSPQRPSLSSPPPQSLTPSSPPPQSLTPSSPPPQSPSPSSKPPHHPPPSLSPTLPQVSSSVFSTKEPTPTRTEISVTSLIAASVSSTTEPSTTPSTEGSKEFKGSGKIDAQWDNDYADSSTPKYKNFTRDLIKHLTEVCKKSYPDDFLEVQVDNFRKGSIIFDFTVYLKATVSVSEESLKDVIEKGEGGSKFTISDVSVKQVAGPKPTTSSTEKPESAGLEKWIIVLIVIGVVILVISLGIVVRQKRRRKGSANVSMRRMSVAYNDSAPFVQNRMYSASNEMYQLSGPGRSNSHGLTTFSAANEGFNGASTITERNSNQLQYEKTL